MIRGTTCYMSHVTVFCRITEDALCRCALLRGKTSRRQFPTMADCQSRAMMQHDSDDNDGWAHDAYNCRKNPEETTANAFASLEAMLASQETTSDNTAAQLHPLDSGYQQPAIDEDPLYCVQRTKDETMIPSSPSTLSNDSRAMGIPHKTKVQPPPRCTHSQPTSRVPPVIKPLELRTVNSRQPPLKKKPTVAHTSKSIVGSRCVCVY